MGSQARGGWGWWSCRDVPRVGKSGVEEEGSLLNWTGVVKCTPTSAAGAVIEMDMERRGGKFLRQRM